MTDSKAVALARAHLEAWTNHDLDAARRNLASDVEFLRPVASPASMSTWKRPEASASLRCRSYPAACAWSRREATTATR